MVSVTNTGHKVTVMYVCMASANSAVCEKKLVVGPLWLQSTQYRTKQSYTHVRVYVYINYQHGLSESGQHSVCADGQRM